MQKLGCWARVLATSEKQDLRPPKEKLDRCARPPERCQGSLECFGGALASAATRSAWFSSPGDGCEHLQVEQEDEPLPPISIFELRVSLSRPAGEVKAVDSWTTKTVKPLPRSLSSDPPPTLCDVSGSRKLPLDACCVVQVLLDKGAGAQPLAQSKICILVKEFRICWIRQLQECGRSKSWDWSRGLDPNNCLLRARTWLRCCSTQQCYEGIKFVLVGRRTKQAASPDRHGRMALTHYKSPSGTSGAGSFAGWVVARNGIVAGCELASNVPHAQAGKGDAQLD